MTLLLAVIAAVLAWHFAPWIDSLGEPEVKRECPK